MTNNIISNQIYLSRDQIRQQIIDYAESYLELENVELSKSSFLSFIINVFSSLTSNLLFYQLSTSKEFFMTEAQLPENILNLSAYIGYKPKESKYSTTDVILTFPLTFSNSDTIYFSIPPRDIVNSDPSSTPFTFYTLESIGFTTDYTVDVIVINNTTVTASITKVGDNFINTYNLPVKISTVGNNKFFSFIIPVKQVIPIEQEYQLESDLQDLQFITLDIPLNGKVSVMEVSIKDPTNNTKTIYTEFSTLFLMGPEDYGYVSRRTTNGRRLYFGNGIIGMQPPSGGTAVVKIWETLGTEGNIISGSIVKGDRIYVNDNGVTRIAEYTVTNPSLATGGEDEESLDEIRRSSIANIVSLKRLVSEYDFINANRIIENSPIGQNSLPILKRSDVKNNEIELFTTLLYNNDIVPTRNIYFTVPTIIEGGIGKIPRDEIINFEGEDYINIFNLYIDEISQFATYQYVLSTIEVLPALETNYGTSFDFIVDQLTVSLDSTSAVKFELHYVSPESDSTSATCVLEILKNGAKYNMELDSTSNTFTTIIDPYEKIPDGSQKFIFYLYAPNPNPEGSPVPIGVYSSTLTFRQVLDDFMVSTALVNDDTSVTLYDVPAIKKSYYDSINKVEFESVVLQNLLTSAKFSGYKMTTDFINLKFSNTTGILENMKYNLVSRLPVKSISQSTVPELPEIGDRYIVNGNETGGDSSWIGKIGNFTEYYSDGTNSQWIFTSPSSNDIVYVENEDKKYIYTDIGWRFPEYTIPLKLEIHVFKDPLYTISFVELSNNIKSTLLSEFGERFGISISLYKSEIIRTVQEILGVKHCRVIKPESDIYFNFELKNLTQTELLKYGPEYIYFTEDDITVKIFQ